MDPLPLRLGERRVPQDVDRQVEAGLEMGRQALEARRRSRPSRSSSRGDVPIPSAARAICCDVREVVPSSIMSAVRLASPPWLGPCDAGPAAEDERRGDDRQVATAGSTQSGSPHASVSDLGHRRPEGGRPGARRADRAVERRRNDVAGLRPVDRQSDPRACRPGSAGRPRATSSGVTCLVALEVGRDPAGVAEIDVVGVEPVGHAAEPADVVQRVDEAGEPAVLDAVQLVGRGRRARRCWRSRRRPGRGPRSHERPAGGSRTTPKLPGQLAARLVGARRPARPLARPPAADRAGSTCPAPGCRPGASAGRRRRGNGGPVARRDRSGRARRGRAGGSSTSSPARSAGSPGIDAPSRRRRVGPK